MAAEEVVLLAVVEPRSKLASTGGAHLPMMVEGPLCERTGRPPFHARGCDGNRVDSAPLDRDVPAAFLEALPTEQLALPVDRVRVDVAIPKGMEIAFDIVGPGHAQPGHRRKLAEQKLEEIWTEGNIRVDVPDDIEGQILEASVSGVDCLHFRSEMTFP